MPTLSRLTASLTIAFVLAPSLALAAQKQLTLPEISKILNENKLPVDFSFDIKGAYDGSTATLSIDGTHNGKMDSVEKAAFDLHGALSVTSDEFSGSAEFDMRLVEQIFYARLTKLTVRSSEFISQQEIQKQVEPYMNVWVRVPLDKEDFDEFKKDAKKQRLDSSERWAQFLSIVTESRNSEWVTTITLPKAKQQRFLQAVSSLSKNYSSPRVNAEMRRTLRKTTIDLRSTVRTLLGKTLKSADTSVTVKTEIEGKPASLTITAKVQTLKSAPQIEVPQQSKTIDELTGSEEQEEIDTLPSEDNPVRARDAQRRADVNTILNANYQYAIDNNGMLPATLEANKIYPICKMRQSCNGVSLNKLGKFYLVTIPSDPETTDEDNATGYTMSRDAEYRITISAPKAEGGVISVTR